MVALAEIWLPIIGAGIFVAWAIGAWYGGDKILATWLILFGAVCLLVLGTLQWQRAIRTEGGGQTDNGGPPKIRIKGITILTPSGGSIWDPVAVLYWTSNEGRSVAHLTQRNYAIHLSKPSTPPKGAPAFDYETEERTRVDIAPGKGIEGQYISKLRLTWEQREELRNGTSVLLFNGYVHYEDDAGIPTSVFFLQRWDYAGERFFTMEDPDYERPDPH
jgi:hypothetical protein